MAEAVAVAASVIAILQITDRIISLCEFYIGSARDAPADLRVMLLEVSTLKIVLKGLQFLTTCNGIVLNAVRGLSGPDGPIEGCHRALAELEKLFPSDCNQESSQTNSKRRKMEMTLAALAWPLRANKAKRLLDELMRYKTTISLTLTAETTAGIQEVKTKTHQIHEDLTANRREQIFTWFQQIDPSPLHNIACTQYELGTGDWMLRSPLWKDWLAAQKRCLWLHGIPGAGKTVLVSSLIEQLKQYCGNGATHERAYIYYYCHFSHQQEETAPFLRWMIVQLCRQADQVPQIALDDFERGTEPTILRLLVILEAVLLNFQNVYVVIDAVDESSPRRNLLEILHHLGTRSQFRKLQILASSREYFDIQQVMQQFCKPVSMANEYVAKDIKVYVRSVLKSNSKLKRWPRELQEDIVEELSIRAGGMFRWAVCQLDVLQRLKPELPIIEKALDNLPKTLDETYDRLFLGISEEDRPFVHHALRWIYYHNELHQGDIGCSVLLQAIARSAKETSLYQEDYLYDEDALHELCGCLIRISYGSIGNPATTQCVSFAHHTVREYISSPRISNGPTSYFMVNNDVILSLSTKIMFSEALRFARDAKQKDLGRINPTAARVQRMQVINNDFKMYCVVSSILAMSIIPRQIFQEMSIRELAVKILHPQGAYFNLLWNAAIQINQRLMCQFPFSDWDAPIHTWNIILDAAFDTTAIAHLVHILIFSEHCKDLELLAGFLKTRHAETAFKSGMSCTESTMAGPTGTVDTIDSDIIGHYAHFKPRHLSQFKLLLEYGAGLYDPSDILIPVILSHDHSLENKAGEYCSLQYLLDNGADPDGKSYSVTPLQIATISRDYEGVRALLQAGADPNRTGVGKDIAWQTYPELDQLNSIHDHTPLWISKPSSNPHDVSGEGREEACRAIGKMLIQYGAELSRDEKEGCQTAQDISERLDRHHYISGRTESGL